MNRNVKAELVVLYFLVIILLAGLFGMTAMRDLTVHRSMIEGAKIGIAANSPSDYRAEEVRGACEDVFTTGECASCHEF